ncbi:MAG: homoserine O-succinyltransferase, partial [Eubacterium sp.]|nr:homoserine O-succinyltransferase [Eubacterium sp.]
AMHQDIRPLHVLILNLMPTKIETETQFLRKLSNTPIQVEVEFMQTQSYQPRHVEESHLDTFYTVFDKVKDRKFDGMIITGAPLEKTRFEDVVYWRELCEIMEWSKTHVHCTLHSCWGACAALYHHYNIPRTLLDVKASGVFEHRALKKKSPLFRGFDDVFYMPHSRLFTVPGDLIEKRPELEIMAVSDEVGIAILKSKDSSQFFFIGHPEYDSTTLAGEYERDTIKGINPIVPAHYFPDDDPKKKPVVRWRSAGQLLYSNWLNYYVYQSTPYDVTSIDGSEEHAKELTDETGE